MGLRGRRSSEEGEAIRRLGRDIFRPLPWESLDLDDELAMGRGMGPSFAPDFDGCETAEAYVFKADLPGVKEENVDISVGGNLVLFPDKRQQLSPKHLGLDGGSRPCQKVDTQSGKALQIWDQHIEELLEEMVVFP